MKIMLQIHSQLKITSYKQQPTKQKNNQATKKQRAKPQTTGTSDGHRDMFPHDASHIFGHAHVSSFIPVLEVSDHQHSIVTYLVLAVGGDGQRLGTPHPLHHWWRITAVHLTLQAYVVAHVRGDVL